MKQVRAFSSAGTEPFSANIRLSTVPGLTQEQYDSLIQGKPTDVEDHTAKYLEKNGFALLSFDEKKKGK